ncbi:hypothetical protein IFM89_013748 [Coptis chinensis]|uniref:RNase H type-1 domain-containing protein n=1 Tax=Coptis chinensis TaxID=261450 RepID=A0A835LR57_9MAGN|nr:hypothetical protein IFM89_013748 [Coptis chinensis]
MVTSPLQRHEEIRAKRNKIAWHKTIWSKHIHPKTATILWKIMHNCAATGEKMQSIGISSVTRCCVCLDACESLQHLIWECPNAQQLWIWMAGKFQIKCAAHMSKGFLRDSDPDKRLLISWGINCKLGRAPQIKPCKWLAPFPHMMKANTDGSSLGNPGRAGWGTTFRDAEGAFKLVYSKGLGISDSYFAECSAILGSMELAIERNWRHLWIESDSQAAIKAFTSDNIPWQMHNRWRGCKRLFTQLLFSHTWREANFAADAVAKIGASLEMNEVLMYEGIPPYLHKWESPNAVYFRFD